MAYPRPAMYIIRCNCEMVYIKMRITIKFRERETRDVDDQINDHDDVLFCILLTVKHIMMVMMVVVVVMIMIPRITMSWW